MKLRVLLILASYLLLTGSSEPMPEVQGGDAESGKSKVSACAACHGADGNSMVGMWPSLAGQNSNYLFKQLKLVQNGDRVIAQMMGVLDNFDDKDLRDIAAYYSNQKNSIGQTQEDLVELGRKLYYSGNLEKGVPSCSACHSPKGKGNGPAGYPLLSGQQSEYIETALKNYRSGERNTGEASQMMMAIAYKLDDSEIKALSSFINGLH